MDECGLNDEGHSNETTAYVGGPKAAYKMR